MLNTKEIENGVIGINQSGNIIKIAINKEIKTTDKKSPHALATIKAASKLGVDIGDARMPYEAGLKALSAGVLIIQILPENCFGYIPRELSPSQLSKLYDEVRETENHMFHSVYEEETYSCQTPAEFFATALNSITSHTLKLTR